MKIIEALKKIKDLTRKSNDIRAKIQLHCADMEYETPIYPNQKEMISSWLQSHRDIIREIGRLKFCLAKTNVNVMVTISLGDMEITHSILEWINRRKDLAKLERSAWEVLSNRGLKDIKAQQSAGQIVDIKLRYYYDIKEKDKWMELLSSEQSLIDAKLEIVNAITELME